MRLSQTGFCFRTIAAVAACFSFYGASTHAHEQRVQDNVSNPADAVGASTASARDLPLAGGDYQRVLVYGVKTATRGVIVMFPGGSGEIDIERDGSIAHGDNFVVRTRESWARRGYGVVIVDATGHRSLRGERSSAAYAADTQEILAFARSLSGLPIWAMGTSQGSIAAMNAAAHARPRELAGVVLTESVSILGKSRETVFDAHPGDVHVPALVLANRNDACWVAPPSMADAIARAMPNSAATVKFVRGGVTKSSNSCSSLSPHGYWGIDEQVVDEIDAWMRGIAST